MSVRSAKRGDEEAIAHIGRESFTWAFGQLFPADVLTRYLDATYSAGKILLSISKPNNVYFVSEAEDRIVGFLKLKRSCRHFLIRDSRQLQVQKIYVLPNAANMGIGSSLMRLGEESVRALAPISAWLMVYEGNHRAVSFYERLGYCPIGRDNHDFEAIRVGFTVMKKDYGA
jgi:ribosomal protein S18 acetylase RimI-like enzyme